MAGLSTPGMYDVWSLILIEACAQSSFKWRRNVIRVCKGEPARTREQKERDRHGASTMTELYLSGKDPPPKE